MYVRILGDTSRIRDHDAGLDPKRSDSAVNRMFCASWRSGQKKPEGNRSRKFDRSRGSRFPRAVNLTSLILGSREREKERGKKVGLTIELAVSRMEARKRIPVTESSGSVQRWPPTSGKDWAGPRRGTGSEARFRQTRGTADDRCPPKRDDSAKTTGGRAEDTSMADQTRDSVDSPLGPQDRRPNQRTTPQLLATKVLSLSSFLTRVTRHIYFCEKGK